jgi:hypothetical protein
MNQPEKCSWCDGFGWRVHASIADKRWKCRGCGGLGHVLAQPAPLGDYLRFVPPVTHPTPLPAPWIRPQIVEPVPHIGPWWGVLPPDGDGSVGPTITVGPYPTTLGDVWCGGAPTSNAIYGGNS